MTSLQDTPIDITREGVTMPHIWQNYKKGPKKDKEKYPGINVEKTPEDFQKFVQFFTFDNTYETLMASYTIMCQQCHIRITEELEKTGLDKNSQEYADRYRELFIKDMTALETRRETIGDLEDANKNIGVQIAELITKQTTLLSSGKPEDQAQAIGLIMEMKKLSDQVTKNNLAIASKQRKKVTDDDEAAAAVTQ